MLSIKSVCLIASLIGQIVRHRVFLARDVDPFHLPVIVFDDLLPDQYVFDLLLISNRLA